MLAGNYEKLVTSPLFAQDSQKLIIYYIFEYPNQVVTGSQILCETVTPDTATAK